MMLPFYILFQIDAKKNDLLGVLLFYVSNKTGEHLHKMTTMYHAKR